jgi:hypothetical protein
MTSIGPGSLKCVIASLSSDLDRVLALLEARVGEEGVRRFGASAVLVQTAAGTSELRDWLKGLGDLLVIEFETWSGTGDKVPREWLLARGH